MRHNQTIKPTFGEPNVLKMAPDSTDKSMNQLKKKTH